MCSNILKRGMKVALVQMSTGADKAKNIAEAVSHIRKAKECGAQLVALPECFNSPYGAKYFAEYAEEVPGGATCRALADAAAECGVCVVGGTLPERCDGRLYNTCPVFDERGNLLAQHRKVHLFDIDIPGKITFRESDSLSAGARVTSFEWRGVRIGLGICYDIRFPEYAHLLASEGCSFLIYPSAFNMITGPKHWSLLTRGRANDQQLWVAMVSPARVPDGEYQAYGHTMLVNPWAEIVEELDHLPGMVVADVDLKMVEQVRSQIPIRSQRRTDIYDVVSRK